MNILKRSGKTVLKCRLLTPSLFVQRNSGAYDAPGVTTASIINHSDVKVNMIDTYSQLGFRLTNKAFLMGPTIILPDKIFYWHVCNDLDVNVASLEFFFHLHPPIDLLIVGLSEPSSKPKVEKEIYVAFRKRGIQVEILPTTKAVPLYNFLAEIRNVAGAFLPPLEYAFTENDVIEHKHRLGILESGRKITEPDRIPISYSKEPDEK